MDLQCHLRLPCPPFGLQASSAAKLPLSFRDLVVSQSRMTLSTSISSAWQLCSCWRGLSWSSTAQSWYLQLFSPVYTPLPTPGFQDDPGIFAVVNRRTAVWAWGLSFSIAGIDQTSILQRCEWRVCDRGKNRHGEPNIWFAQRLKHVQGLSYRCVSMAQRRLQNSTDWSRDHLCQNTWTWLWMIQMMPKSFCCIQPLF